ncbi:hypothetical protein D9M73_31090 [compost metagenome]
MTKGFFSSVLGFLLTQVMMLASVQAQGVFSEDPANGCKVWNAVPSPNESVRWQGQCTNGFASGEGRLSFITPANRSEYTSYWLAGRMIGRFERISFDASGAETGRGAGYGNETVMNDYYQKNAIPGGGYSIRYYAGKVLQGVYRQDMSDNRERAVYMLDGGQDLADKRKKVIYLARYNPATQNWSSWPTEAQRDKDQLHAYVVVSGMPKNWSLSECAGNSYDACLELFQQKLAASDYGDWSAARMASVDAQWAERLKGFAASQKAVNDHAALIKSGAADKLFTYGSRQEQDKRYDWALDAYRAIVERFPQSKFFDLAAARMPAVQDKLDRQQEQMAAGQARQQADAQRLQLQQAEGQRRDAEAARLLSQRQVAYDQCLARADQCKTECNTTAGAGLLAGLAGLANPKSINMNGLNQINQKAQNTCNRCDSIAAECALAKP